MILESETQSSEYQKLLNYQKNLNNLLLQDKYISHHEYMVLYNDLKELYAKLNLMKEEDVLTVWCSKNNLEYSKFLKLINFYEQTAAIIQNHNEEFINNHLKSEEKYLDQILALDDPQILLDEEQRRAILTDEDYTLIIAGAGAGKTTTIEAKVKYLIEKQNINPDKILIVSFTKKATKELQDRCQKLQLPIHISTFHSIANTIIKNNESEKHHIATPDVMFTTIKNFFLENASDEILVKKILLFFASYLQTSPNEENLAVLIQELAKNDCTTMRSDIAQTIANYQKQQEKKHHTIQNEVVKSIEECRIANFLFINGIDYEYEPIYPYGFKDTLKPYCPDFLIKQYDKEIYLEHFGISEDGKNSRFTKEELELYKQHINDKILLHKEHKTNLIYTFSKYNDGRDTITHLKEELQKSGISLEPKNNKEIYQCLLKNMEDKYFNKFIQLVCVFISRFKTNNFTLSKFDEWKISVTDERTKLFINICYQCYLAYMTYLKNINSIDFEDMINNAINILDQKIKNNENLPYEYIFIDEYQDISLQRFDLCEKLAQCSTAKIIAVGDDWQSIFKFSGAKIELFTRFKEIFPTANILKITKTYRNSQELIDIAGNFVMKNDLQIQKELKSNKSLRAPIVLMTYKDSYNKEDSNKPIDRMCLAILNSLDIIVKKHGKNSNVLLIGRYGFEGFQLTQQTKYFTFKNGYIYALKYPDLKMTYLTAHSSKGLGYDNVIIINGKDAILGFPSKIVDDPVMQLVIKDTEDVEYAEERRLFYVALTRTKNRVFIITPINHPSKFILEIKNKYENIILGGNELKPIEKLNNTVTCPYCGFPLQKRENKNFKLAQRLWICSNDPEVCGFVTNDLRGGKLSITKCPNCQDGYLIVKMRKNSSNTSTKVLGCTNYKSDKTGCNTIMFPQNYTQDREEFSLKFQNSKLDITTVTFCGYLFPEMVDIILKVIKKLQDSKIDIDSKRLFSLLSGTDDQLSINKYNFNKIKMQDKKKFYALLNSLIDNHFINIDYHNYSKLSLVKESLKPNDYALIFAGIKL